MKKALLYTLYFVSISLVAGAVCSWVYPLFADHVETVDSGLLVLTSAASSILCLVVFLSLRFVRLSPVWLLRGRTSWTILLLCVLAALGSLAPSMWLQEQMPDLSDLLEKEFIAIMSRPEGYAVLALFAPLVEEVVFRGAVLRSLLDDSRIRPLWAVVISALLFALIHLNPAQMPHAFLLGLLLGWVYYRTGSILPGVAVHWANNTCAYVLFLLYPDPNLQLSDLFGSPLRIGLSILYSLMIFVPSLYLLKKQTDTP